MQTRTPKREGGRGEKGEPQLTLRSCVQCEGARVSSTEGYWRHPSNFTCPPDACNSAGDCDMRRCTAAAVDAQLVVGLGRAQVDWQQRAIVLACPPGVCRAEDECEQGNWGPVCGRCKPEHARQGHRCYHCNPDQEFRARVSASRFTPLHDSLKLTFSTLTLTRRTSGHPSLH